MRYAIFLIIVFAVPAIAFSATIKVPGDYPTIQQAIDAAKNGDIVSVAPGTYVENIFFNGKAITVMSSHGPACTTIDGKSPANPLYGSVVIFIHGEEPDSVLKGFTLTNGSGTVGYGGNLHGGGIYCEYASPTIINNVIVANSTGSKGRGGGMNNYICDGVTVINCIFCENDAKYRGGGIANDQSDLTLINCLIENNTALQLGGGIYSFLSDVTVVNGTFEGNSAPTGGAMHNYSTSATVTNSILWNNSPDEIYLYGSGTADVSFSCVKGGYPGAGNIDSDPLFIDPGDGDYHLTWPSPCRDVGDNSAVIEPIDFEGDPRIAYGTVDMGVDEFHTHLYWTGDAIPGGNAELKFVGMPGTMPIRLWLGSGVLDPPWPTKYGDWYLEFPLLAAVPNLGAIPSKGVYILAFTFPADTPTPLSMPLQAGIGAELTNLLCMQIQ